MAETRYYWLKLQHDFFQSKRIKKLRKLAGGDTYTIIYLKMQLKAILNGGLLTFTGIEPTFAEELALDIDEEPDNVLVTVNYLLSCGLLESSQDGSEYILPYAVENTGSETSGAKRVREFRARQALLCNGDVTERNENRNGEEEKEKEEDKEVDKEKYKAPRKRFAPPTLEDVQAYCSERKNSVDAQRFIDYYSSNGWKVGKNPMRDWKAAVRTWERSGYDSPKKKAERPYGANTGPRDDSKTMEQIRKLRERMVTNG